jgi:protein-disulfide isomerase
MYRNRKEVARNIAVWFLIISGFGGAIFAMVYFTLPSPQSERALVAEAVSGSDWVSGEKNAKVVMIEYSDFQCPACRAYYPLVQKLEKEFSGKMSFVYRHFPLAQHANARPAAYAAEAAGKQGKFWQMHDLLFENQDEWAGSRNAEEIFAKYAASLGMDVQKFKDDFNSGEVKKKVDSDYQSGIKAGINATPTFFISGKSIRNPGGYDEFRNIIIKEINNS